MAFNLENMKDEIKEQAKKTVEAEQGLQTRAYKRLIIPYASTVLELAALLGLTGLLTFFQFNGKINEVAPHVLVIYLVLRIAMIFFSKDTASRTRVMMGQHEKEHLDIIKALKDAAENVKQDKLDAYIKNIANPARKISAWKASVYPKIERQSNIIEKLTIKRRIAERKGNTKEVEKLTKKLIKPTVKRDELLYIISDEYINENFDFLPVKYNKIVVNQFFISNLDAEIGGDKYEINVGAENKKGIAIGMPFSICIACFLVLTGLDSITLGSVDLLTLLLDILSIAFNMATGWFFIGSKTLAKQRKVLSNKTVFLEEYKSYESNKMAMEQNSQPVAVVVESA